MKRLIQQGERAKPFFLKDNRDKEVRLSDFKGEEGPSFHPLAWTSVCAEQMKALEANKKKFDLFNDCGPGAQHKLCPLKCWAKNSAFNISACSLISGPTAKSPRLMACSGRPTAFPEGQYHP